MATTYRTAFNLAASAAGLTDANGLITKALNATQLDELLRIATASGVQLAVPALTAAGVQDQWVIAPIASQTNTITIVSAAPGHSNAAGVTTVQIGDNASDALAVTWTAGAVFIKLANATDSNNTLTLILAALNALNTSTNGAVLSAFITGTASTQMVHGGTNTLAATAAGGTAGTGLKSSTSGPASGLFTVNPTS
jgi:hypothetical protein